MTGGQIKHVEKTQWERLSQFRYQLRRFLRVSEDAARRAGITTLQHQLLLHTQGFEGRDWASVGELAERLQAQPHGVVALVTRCEQAGLVRRRENDLDRRLVEVHLTAKGRRTLEKVSASLDAERLALAQVADRAG
ncbi:MarR family transcriptional regulator [Ramlibacter sp. AW1]|uniref:MarR family transcriptional regulator n=1 Tax=Ramlibacter aurantiacus TaxID=2801330 RepID=A0A936ZGR1_9BURK|nr:MarR family transcriptional regulator [Ramlibacter aurantiacus]MBL0419953.1 MarR family transcriptional regulator [Ramlibacter aurantiacus]